MTERDVRLGIGVTNVNAVGLFVCLFVSYLNDVNFYVLIQNTFC